MSENKSETKTETPPSKLPPELQARVDEAAAIEAEAKARKAAADAEAAELTAQQNRRSAANYDPSLSREETAATSRKNVAQAELETAKAHREQLAALIPDLSKADRGSLTVDDSVAPILGSQLTFTAMNRAAQAIAANIEGVLPTHDQTSTPLPLLLVTTNLDLASTDAAYHEVMSGLDELLESIAKLPEPTDPQLESIGGLDVLATVASAIPSVLSLLSAHRTLTGKTVDPNHVAAAAAVAGALQGKTRVLHETFRLVPNGRVFTRLRELSESRNELTSHQLAQQEAIRVLSQRAAAAAEQVTTLEAEIAKAKKAGKPVEELNQQLAEAERGMKSSAAAESAARSLLAAMDSMAAAADSFCAAIRETGANGRSPLVTAALHEQLHPEEPRSSEVLGGDHKAASTDPAARPPELIDYALVVQAEPGQVVQSIDDKPFFIKDRFSTYALGSITYLLLQISTNTIVRAGTITRSASAHGKIGDDFEIKRPQQTR